MRWCLSSAATANILFCHLTENVGVIPLFFFLEILFCQFFVRFIARIPLLYYAVHFFGFLLSEKSKRNVNLVNRLSNSSLYVVAQFPPKTSTPCARIRITIEIGAKNEVLDPAYPLPCLPSWRKPLSYRKSKVLRRRPLTLETSAIHQISQAKNIPYQLLLIKPIFSLLANAGKTCSLFFKTANLPMFPNFDYGGSRKSKYFLSIFILLATLISR